MTNSLKHGRAGEAYVFIKMNLKEIEVFVLDNGRGCGELAKGPMEPREWSRE
jgi:signal transduction histidine kinase